MYKIYTVISTLKWEEYSHRQYMKTWIGTNLYQSGIKLYQSGIILYQTGTNLYQVDTGWFWNLDVSTLPKIQVQILAHECGRIFLIYLSETELLDFIQEW